MFSAIFFTIIYILSLAAKCYQLRDVKANVESEIPAGHVLLSVIPPPQLVCKRLVLTLDVHVSRCVMMCYVQLLNESGLCYVQDLVCVRLVPHTPKHQPLSNIPDQNGTFGKH